MLKSVEGNFDHPEVNELLTKHFIELRAASPKGSTHVLDIPGLKVPSIKFWSLWNDKNLLGDGKTFDIDQYDSIENEFNNILSDQELNENSLAPEKQKSKKTQEKLNIESTELLLADINIKTSENHSDSNLGNISTKSKKEKIAF